MTNSYCGKNCGFCVSRTEGKCIGCKPEVFVPLHDSVYIPGKENTTLPNKTDSKTNDMSNDPDDMISGSNSGTTSPVSVTTAR